MTVIVGGGHGSGLYIADGLLLTNHHVADRGATVKVRFSSGQEIYGTTIAANARRDVALIKTEPVGVAGIPIRTEDPAVGEDIFVLGSPLDIKLENTLSRGIISGFREEDGKRFVQSDVNTQHGNSGGPDA